MGSLLLAFWLVHQHSGMGLVASEVSMILAGSLVGGSLLLKTPLKLLQSLPLCPRDIVRGQVLVASKWAALSLAPLLSILWLADVLWLRPSGRSLQIQGVTWAILIFLLALFFTLALGQSTNLSRGGLSAYRRRVVMCQAALLLHSHWVLESLSASDAGYPTAFLKIWTPGALILLCAWTLRAQLRAGLARVQDPMWDIQDKYQIWVWLPAIVVIAPLQLSDTGNLKVLIYLALLVHFYLSLRETSTSRRATALKWLDLVFFIGLVQADFSLWMHDLTVEATLGIQLLVVLVWWGLQNVGQDSKPQRLVGTAQSVTPAPFNLDGPPPAPPAYSLHGAAPHLATPHPQIDVAGHRRQRLAQRASIDRGTHFVRSTCRDFFTSTILQDRTISIFLLTVTVFIFFISPIYIWGTPFISLPPLAALFTVAIIDHLRGILIQHPLMQTLPVTYGEMGRSLLLSTARLAVLPLGGLLALQLLAQRLDDTPIQGLTLGLTCISSGILMGILGFVGVLISLPKPAGVDDLSKSWRLAAVFQMTLASSCILLAYGTPQLSPASQLLAHGLIWSTLLSNGWFAWRTQQATLATGVGMSPPAPKGRTQSGLAFDKRWLMLPIFGMFLYMLGGTVGGIGPFITLISLAFLVLYPQPVTSKPRNTAPLLPTLMGALALVTWLVVRSIIRPIDSDLHPLYEHLFVLVTWTVLWIGYEARRLNKAGMWPNSMVSRKEETS